MRKVLIVTTVASTTGAFNMVNIEMLHSLGYEVTVATHFVSGGSWSIDMVSKLRDELSAESVQTIDVPFPRTILSAANYRSFKQVKDIISTGDYDLIHCQTPVAAAIVRLAAHLGKSKSYMLYTCHGFNFHSTSSVASRALYKGIERYLSRFTDEIITINREDYNLARRFRKGLKIDYIHGVGVDTEKIRNADIDSAEYSRLLGLPNDAYILLSVGELIPRKNHRVVIDALADIPKEYQENMYYLICGEGPLRQELEEHAASLGVAEHVRFLGFRSDIPQLCKLASISVIPSLIEGLGLAGIESMAAGTPVIGARVQGIKDYTIDGETGYSFSPTDSKYLSKLLSEAYLDKGLKNRLKNLCIEMATRFDIKVSYQEQLAIYRDINGFLDERAI